jgi:hypothetical protein
VPFRIFFAANHPATRCCLGHPQISENPRKPNLHNHFPPIRKPGAGSPTSEAGSRRSGAGLPRLYNQPEPTSRPSCFTSRAAPIRTGSVSDRLNPSRKRQRPVPPPKPERISGAQRHPGAHAAPSASSIPAHAAHTRCPAPSLQLAPTETTAIPPKPTPPNQPVTRFASFCKIPLIRSSTTTYRPAVPRNQHANVRFGPPHLYNPTDGRGRPRAPRDSNCVRNAGTGLGFPVF